MKPERQNVGTKNEDTTLGCLENACSVIAIGGFLLTIALTKVTRVTIKKRARRANR